LAVLSSLPLASLVPSSFQTRARQAFDASASGAAAARGGRGGKGGSGHEASAGSGGGAGEPQIQAVPSLAADDAEEHVIGHCGAIHGFLFFCFFRALPQITGTSLLCGFVGVRQNNLHNLD